ncbi:MAG: Gfo/Idh/MocA family oxidoreductase [Chloroflexaceae bacterium]|nr:Gfo/Idh/MocA family oxidoreductase [Chloroflexaceae bacterium]
MVISLPLQVGIVGTGYVAARRAEAFEADERTRLVAASGHTWETTLKFGQTYGAEPQRSWQELVNLSHLDLVAVCNVNCDRAEIVRGALAAGKHVIVEYPLAIAPADAQSLLELAAAQGKLLHVEHIELLGGLHQVLKQYLPLLGQVFYARYITITGDRPAAHRWTYHRELFGFPLVGALSRVHRLTDLLGAVAAVSCQTRYWNAPEAGYFRACLCNAQLRFTNGLIAEVVYGKGEVFWQGYRDFELHGEAGSLMFAGDAGRLIQGQEQTPIEVGSRRGLIAKDTTMVIDHLVEGTPLYVNPQASYYALQVADAARESAATGQTVFLSTIR